MKKIALLVLYAIVFFIGFVVLLCCVGEGMVNEAQFKAGIYLLVGIPILAGVILSKPEKMNRTTYEEWYGYILKGAFPSDEESYRKLLKAVSYFDRREYWKALKVLEKLEPKCNGSKDHIAVGRLRGLCLQMVGWHAQSIPVYEKLVKFDGAIAEVWANMGLAYLETGRVQDAYNACEQAISIDPECAVAYGNLSVYYLKIGEARKALECAEKCILRNVKVHQAIRSAAMACRMLGDREGEMKYCNMYVVNGGNRDQLMAQLKTIK